MEVNDTGAATGSEYVTNLLPCHSEYPDSTTGRDFRPLFFQLLVSNQRFNWGFFELFLWDNGTSHSIFNG